MKIGIITPAPPGSSLGNRITALRWAKILRNLGHRVSVSQNYENQRFDLLIALHARRSHSSVARFRKQLPDRPVILALTGTDVYRDIHSNSRARESLTLADRIVVLQPRALRELTSAQQKKAVVIHQSVEPLPPLKESPRMANTHFDICVIGHLRPVKDPFRASLAARLLPPSSQIRIVHVGGAMSKPMERRARAEMQINPRYSWRGELSRKRTLDVLERSKACVISSRMEGGANVLSEAIAAGVPVLASRIAGNVGILGEDYQGLFQIGDTCELVRLMLRVETDRNFLRSLQRRVIKLAPLFDRELERRAWANLISAITS